MSFDDEIISGFLGQISDGERVRTYLLTTAPYHDPALAAQIEYGTALAVIPQNAGLSISERISFQPQGGGSSVAVSELPLINDEGEFDAWGGWILSGLEWTFGRGYRGQPWADWWHAYFKGRGKPEFRPGRRVVITLGDWFSYMRQPIARQVFSDDDVSNTRLINTTVPLVFGSAFQVKPLVTEPQIQRYAVAANANDIPAVQAGGNPTTPVYEVVPLGFQLFQSPSLQITCDVTGPPVEGWEENDVLVDIGSFVDWTDGYPDGWDVAEDEPWSVISESVDGHAQVENTARIDGTTDWITATEWTAELNANSGESFEPNPGTDSLADVLEADDGTYAVLSSGYSEAHRMNGTGWSFGLTEDVQPVKMDVRITLDTNGGNQDVVLNSFHLRYPDGTARNLLAPGSNYAPTTKDTLEFTIDNNLADVYKMTREILEDPAFELRLQVRQVSGTNQTVRVHEIALRVHYGTVVDRLRLTSQADVMTPGNRYLLRIHTVGDSGDSIKGYWGGVDAHSAPVPSSDNPFAQISAQLEGDDVHEFAITAAGPKFAIEFDRGTGNGEQEIKRVELIDKSGSRKSFKELQRYNHELFDQDPDEVCDNDALELMQTQMGNPSLGWYIDDQTTAEQLSTLYAHSGGGAAWGGLRKKWTAAQMRVPQQPDGDYLSIVGSFGPGNAVPDTGEDLRDRVHAARNVHPLRDSETAGVTSTWPEDQRQLVLDKWRITEKADWSNLEGFPTFTLTGIDPSTGDTEGGTTVTLTGTGLSAFDSSAGDTIMFGDNAATNITVVSDTEITCDTPAGTEGSVDVTLTLGSESRSLAFEYVSSGGGGGWTPADLTDLLVWHHTRDPANYTLDGGAGTQWDDLSGNDYHATQSGTASPPLVTDAIGGFPAFDFQNDSHHFDLLLSDAHGEYVIFAMLDPDNESGFREYVFTAESPLFGVAHSGGSDDVASYDGSWQNYGDPQTGEQSLLWNLVEGPGAAEAFRNGVSIGTATWSSHGISGTEVSIGNRPGQNQELNGRIGEFLIVRAPLSQDDIDKIVGYAHHAWGRSDLLPAGHTYKSSPP